LALVNTCRIGQVSSIEYLHGIRARIAAMSRLKVFLLVASAAVVAAGSLVFLSYTSEIDRARAMASSGGRMANTTAGQIEYAEKAPVRRCFPSTALAAAMIKVWPT
jgi:hypothetical protein